MTLKITYASLLLVFLTIGQKLTAQLKVVISLKAGQTTKKTSPVIFTATFSAAINEATFTTASVILTGTATNKVVSLIKKISATVFDITVTANNDGTVMANIPNSSGTASNTGLNPQALLIDNTGNIFVANKGSNNISKITPSGLSTILGTTGLSPSGIAIDTYGNLYTCNYSDNNVSKITPSGVSSILGKTGRSPMAIVIDVTNNLYTLNRDSTVSKITPSGVSTVFSYFGSQAYSMSIDQNSNIYLLDGNNLRIMKITSTGVLSIFSSSNNVPQRITTDYYGRTYVLNADTYITKISSSGTISTFGQPSMLGQYIVADNSGNVYTGNISRNGQGINASISQITWAGVRTDYILPSSTSDISCIGLSSSGQIYVADFNNNSLYSIFPAGIAVSGQTTPSNTASTTTNNTYVLPVALVYFTAINNACNTLLIWQSSDEINSKNYIIETSLDGVLFSESAKIESKNSATGATYNYKLTGKANSTTFYRLKMVDVDGSYTFSKTVLVKPSEICGTANQIKVSPNPSKNYITVEGLSIGSNLSLINSAGIKVTGKEATSNSEKINISSYAKGIYVLRINAADGSMKTVKVIKQ